MHRTRSQEHSGALCLQSCRLKGLGKVFGNKNGSGLSPVSLCCLFLCYAVSPESSSVERAAIRPQKLSTKLPGKRPVLPFLCNVPLYQPSSRFLCTNTMSPSFSSISASLCGGYGTTTRYLWRKKCKDLVSLRSMGAAGHQYQRSWEKNFWKYQ